MGSGSSKPTTSYMSTGSSVFVNEKGETVMDTFQNRNGDFFRQTETGQLPPSGGYISQSVHAPWIVAGAAMVLLALSVVVFAYSRKPLKKQEDVTLEDGTNPASIPLYSLAKPRTQHASDAMWNIDLLDDAE